MPESAGSAKHLSTLRRATSCDTTRDVQAKITEVLYRIDINTLHRVEDDVTIGVNAMARVRIKTASPLLPDGYKHNRSTGSFILVDPSTHLTVAAGVVG